MARLSLASLLVVLLSIAVCTMAYNYGIDTTNPAFANLFQGDATQDVQYDDVSSFEELYVDYFGKKGTLVLDCREFPEALTIVYNTYIVPASVFAKHATIFPANRNYFIYGPIENCAKVQAILKQERGATFAKLIDLRPNVDIKTVWRGEFQYKLAPYYETIGVEDMYDRYVDGEPQEQDPILVDIRSPAEFNKIHIKYAVNVPFNKLKENFDVLPVTQKVYLYSNNDTLTIAGAELFAKEFRSYSMPILGGLDQWIAKGYPTDSTIKHKQL